MSESDEHAENWYAQRGVTPPDELVHRVQVMAGGCRSLSRAAELLGINRGTLMRVICRAPVHRGTLAQIEAELPAAEVESDRINREHWRVQLEKETKTK